MTERQTPAPSPRPMYAERFRGVIPARLFIVLVLLAVTYVLLSVLLSPVLGDAAASAVAMFAFMDGLVMSGPFLNPSAPKVSRARLLVRGLLIGAIVGGGVFLIETYLN